MLTIRYSLNAFSEPRPIRELELVEANKSSKTGLGLKTDSTAFLSGIRQVSICEFGD